MVGEMVDGVKILADDKLYPLAQSLAAQEKGSCPRARTEHGDRPEQWSVSKASS